MVMGIKLKVYSLAKHQQGSMLTMLSKMHLHQISVDTRTHAYKHCRQIDQTASGSFPKKEIFILFFPNISKAWLQWQVTFVSPLVPSFFYISHKRFIFQEINPGYQEYQQELQLL